MLRKGHLASLVAAQAQKEANLAANLAKCLRLVSPMIPNTLTKQRRFNPRAYMRCSMFADIYSSASPQNPHLHLSRFFTLQSMIEKADATTQSHDTDSSALQEKDKPIRKPGKNMNMNTNTPKTTRISSQLSSADKQEWSKMDNSREMMELLRTLTNETRAWFLNFLEEALEFGFPVGQERKGKESSARVLEQNNHIALTLSQLKQANEWLDKAKSGSGLEVLGRIDELKQKVYACLLVHIDFAASALDTRKSL